MVHIEITNFQTIAHVKFSFEGFCTLVGENFIGKSAVLRAINAALTNPSGMNYIRWGETYCEVRIKTEFVDLLWHKEQGNNFYDITCDGKTVRYDKIGKDAPPDILNKVGLGLNKVGGDKLNLLYASQFTPLFLVDKRDAKSADLLTAVYGLDRLYKAIELCNKDQKANSDILRLRRKDVEIYKQDLDKYKGFEDVLKRKELLVQDKNIIDALDTEISDLKVFHTKAVELSFSMKKLQAVKDVSIPDANAIKTDISEFNKVSKFTVTYESIQESIKNLNPVQTVRLPDGQDIAALSKDLKTLDDFILRGNKLQSAIKALSAVENIALPTVESIDFKSVDYIDKSIKSIIALRTESVKIEEEHGKFIKEIASLEEEKKSFKGLCPLCGNELKNDTCVKD